MKKLNRKGFTLVELLAVIIILAIVVGISIPAITSIINNTKNSALGVAVESAYDYLRDQYDIYNIDPSLTSEAAKRIINGRKAVILPAHIEELGFKYSDVWMVFATVTPDPANNTTKICVIVKTINTEGDYFTPLYWDDEGHLKDGIKNGQGVKNQAGECD